MQEGRIFPAIRSTISMSDAAMRACTYDLLMYVSCLTHNFIQNTHEFFMESILTST
jgi:hypothetical protein